MTIKKFLMPYGGQHSTELLTFYFRIVTHGGWVVSPTLWHMYWWRIWADEKSYILTG